jgi:hypothetical protein
LSLLLGRGLRRLSLRRRWRLLLRLAWLRRPLLRPRRLLWPRRLLRLLGLRQQLRRRSEHEDGGGGTRAGNPADRTHGRALRTLQTFQETRAVHIDPLHIPKSNEKGAPRRALFLGSNACH